MDFLEGLKTRVLCGDGAIGTRLLETGITLDRCFEELCLSEPDRIRAIHGEYVAAGAHVIETNTFGANAVRLGRFGLQDRVSEINAAAVSLARESIGSREAWVAGSVGPLGIGGDEAAHLNIDRSLCFQQQIAALVEAGVDLIFLETFTDAEEMEIAYRAGSERNSLPIICSYACGPEGQLACGTSLVDALADLEKIGAKLFGVNCMNDPETTLSLVRSLPQPYRVAVYPTSGMPIKQDGVFLYPVDPVEFNRVTPQLISEGVRLIGGCCGTTPAHVAAIASAIARCE